MSRKLGFEGLNATGSGSCLAAYSRSLTAIELSPHARQASFNSTFESTNRPTVVVTTWNVALSLTSLHVQWPTLHDAASRSRKIKIQKAQCASTFRISTGTKSKRIMVFGEQTIFKWKLHRSSLIFQQGLMHCKHRPPWHTIPNTSLTFRITASIQATP
jgi:hypothetical protein